MFTVRRDANLSVKNVKNINSLMNKLESAGLIDKFKSNKFRQKLKAYK